MLTYSAMTTMTKSEAVELFGSPALLGEALGISRHAIYQWPEVLDQERIDRVTGAAIRLGKPLPTLHRDDRDAVA